MEATISTINLSIPIQPTSIDSKRLWSEITIDRLLPDESLVGASVLAEAFLASPTTKAVWQNQVTNARQAMTTIFRIMRLEHQDSVVLVARRCNKTVGTLNMVESPHCRLSALESIKLMPRILKATGWIIIRGFQLQNERAKHDPRVEHWHLGPIAVLPEFQGQGIGSRMLEKCLEIIDQSHLGAYLETDVLDNVHWYQRFGFVVTGELQLMGVTTWFMWRDPRPIQFDRI